LTGEVNYRLPILSPIILKFAQFLDIISATTIQSRVDEVEVREMKDEFLLDKIVIPVIGGIGFGVVVVLGLKGSAALGAATTCFTSVVLLLWSLVRARRKWGPEFDPEREKKIKVAAVITFGLGVSFTALHFIVITYF
jgi:hypothetical protein